MLHTKHYNEVIRRHTLGRARFMFVTDLIRDTLTSPTPRRNAIAPEMDVITTLTTSAYLATGKMQLCSSDDLGQPRLLTQIKGFVFSSLRVALRLVLNHF